jgi:hypothetical protein
MSEDRYPPDKRLSRGDPIAPMKINKVTNDILTGIITVYWDAFTEPSLSGYIVTINQVWVRLDNYPVNNPSAVSAAIGYTLQAGSEYQAWVTPATTPLRVPDDAHASDPVPIPYNA